VVLSEDRDRAGNSKIAIMGLHLRSFVSVTQVEDFVDGFGVFHADPSFPSQVTVEQILAHGFDKLLMKPIGTFALAPERFTNSLSVINPLRHRELFLFKLDFEFMLPS